MTDAVIDLVIKCMKARACSPTMGKFANYHAGNPHIYAFLVDGLDEMVGSGREKYGFAVVWQHCRWDLGVKQHDQHPDFELPDQLFAYYVRAILILNPRFNTGLLSMRSTKTADQDFGVHPVHGVLEEGTPPPRKPPASASAPQKKVTA
jgi:hypothetical protein